MYSHESSPPAVEVILSTRTHHWDDHVRDLQTYMTGNDQITVKNDSPESVLFFNISTATPSTVHE